MVGSSIIRLCVPGFWVPDFWYNYQGVNHDSGNGRSR